MFGRDQLFRARANWLRFDNIPPLSTSNVGCGELLRIVRIGKL